MKKWLPVLALLLAALLAILWLSPPAHSPKTSGATAPPDAAVQAALDRASPKTLAAIDAAFAPAASAVAAAAQPTPTTVPPTPPTASSYTNLPPETVMENVRRAVRDYSSRFGGNPVGTNLEITRALAGDNPRQVNFLVEDAGLRRNDHGELVDPWGVPFFFHQLSAHEMEIRSAGPDRILWTADDLVAR